MKRRPKRQNIPTDFHADSKAEALFLEQAQAYFREIQNVAQNAPDGKVLDQTETAIVLQGRELVRQSLELTMQEQIDGLEKKQIVSFLGEAHQQIFQTNASGILGSLYCQSIRLE